MSNYNWKKLLPREVVLEKEEKLVTTTIVCDLIWVEGVATWKPNTEGKYEYDFIKKTGKIR